MFYLADQEIFELLMYQRHHIVSTVVNGLIYLHSYITEIIILYQLGCLHAHINLYSGVNAIISVTVDESYIMEDSVTLTCELACFSPGLRCNLSNITTDNGDVVNVMTNDVNGSRMAYSYPTQDIVVSDLKSGTTYNYCVIAIDNVTMEKVGTPVCGHFRTTSVGK